MFVIKVIKNVVTQSLSVFLHHGFAVSWICNFVLKRWFIWQEFIVLSEFTISWIINNELASALVLRKIKQWRWILGFMFKVFNVRWARLQTFYILPTFAHLTATQNILRCEVCFKCILPVDGKVENKINISWLETGIEDHPHLYNL